MNKTESYKINAQIAGILWLLAIVAGMVGVVFLGDYQGIETNLALFSQNETNILVAAFLILVMCFSTANIAIFLYPVLKKYNESMALSSVGFRLLETVCFTIGALGLLLLLVVSNEYVNSGSPADTSYQLLTHTFLRFHDMSSSIAGFAFNAGAFMYCYIFIRTKLVPRGLGALGIIAVSLGMLDAFLSFFGFYFGFDPISIVLNLPTLLFELILGFWLIIKGFDQEALSSLG
ncbi:MAG: DUF4386 domain-containing protein [Candidatus Thorarchaeota archaeon]